MDANQDGHISRQEWISQMGNDNLFENYDTDGDGELSPQEWLATRLAGSHRRRDASGSSSADGSNNAFPTATPTRPPTPLDAKICTLQKVIIEYCYQILT